jgi:anti-sigma factor RsiW
MAGRHTTTDDLELHVLERLADERAAPVKEHLLVCEECRARQVGWDEDVGSVQAAMRRAARNPR